MPEAIYREGGVQGLDVANRDAACRRRLPGRQEEAGRAPPTRHRGKAARLGVRAEVVSGIETERAKRMATRDSYEELLDRIEGRETGD